MFNSFILGQTPIDFMCCEPQNPKSQSALRASCPFGRSLGFMATPVPTRRPDGRSEGRIPKRLAAELSLPDESVRKGALSRSPVGELQSLPACCVRPSWELILESEGARGSPVIRGTAGACRSRHVRAKTWPPETGDELSVNMPPSGMKENNVCSGAVRGDHAGADGPSRKADCEGGDGRDLP